MPIPAALSPHFAKLKEALEEQQYTDIDLFDLIGNFSQTTPAVGAALAFHVVDILRELEAGAELDYSALTIEAYRRTFFDAEAAAKFGTDCILITHPEHAASFVQSIIYGFDAKDGAGLDTLVNMDTASQQCH